MSTEMHPTHSYTADGNYTAALTVTTPQGRSSSDRVTIIVGDSPPTATITNPAAGSTYVMGTPLAFSGSAIDGEDGPLPAESLRWNARFFFNGHFHPNFFQVADIFTGTLNVPLHNDNTTLFLCLTATDSQGLQDTDCVELHPQTAPYRFETDPTGLNLVYDGVSYTAPFTVPMMVNAPRSIRAPLEQAGLPFVSWSDGGAAAQTIVGQPEPQILVATYRLRVWLPLVLRGNTP